MNPASERLLEHFTWDHLPASLQVVSASVARLAREMAEVLDSTDPVAGTEVTTGLRRLLEAKDCFVRARVALERASTTPAAQGESGEPRQPQRGSD
jgi:Escherichia/Staphylococcus phage prohead protease